MEVIPIVELDKITLNLIDGSYDTISNKYGKTGLRPRSYHNENHTKNVVEASMTISDLAIKRGKLAPKIKGLIAIAAAFHDIEQDKGSNKNEIISAYIAQTKMRETHSFSEDDIATVGVAIMATRFSLMEGRIVQAATGEPYSAQILADADLANLGFSNQAYWENSLAIFDEVYGTNTMNTPRKLEILSNQVSLLRHHVYYTSEALELYPGQLDNLAFTEAMLQSVDSSDL